MVRLLFRAVFLAFALAAGAFLAIYAAGRVFTDRFHITQFLSWAPGAWLLGSATIATVIFVLGRLLSRAARLGVPERWAGRVLGVALIAAWLHFSLVEVRVQRWLSGPAPLTGVLRATAPPGRAVLRIMQWNATSPDVVPRPALLKPLLADFEPDVLFACVAMAPHQLQAVVSELAPELHTRRQGLVLVVSRWPILDMASYPLGLADPGSAAFVPPTPGSLPPAPDALHAQWETLYNSYGPMVGLQRRQFRNADPGFITQVRLAPAPEGEEPVVLWHVDLPSDPLRSKWLAAEQIAARLRELAQPALGTPATPLVAPDVIIGDFNTPHGAASIRRAFGPLRSVFDSVAGGTGATWPRRAPLLQIDQALVGPGTLPLGWGSIDPGEGDHVAIVVDVAPAR